MTTERNTPAIHAARVRAFFGQPPYARAVFLVSDSEYRRHVTEHARFGGYLEGLDPAAKVRALNASTRERRQCYRTIQIRKALEAEGDE